MSRLTLHPMQFLVHLRHFIEVPIRNFMWAKKSIFPFSSFLAPCCSSLAFIHLVQNWVIVLGKFWLSQLSIILVSLENGQCI